MHLNLSTPHKNQGISLSWVPNIIIMCPNSVFFYFLLFFLSYFILLSLFRSSSSFSIRNIPKPYTAIKKFVLGFYNQNLVVLLCPSSHLSLQTDVIVPTEWLLIWQYNILTIIYFYNYYREIETGKLNTLDKCVFPNVPDTILYRGRQY